jgi:hypothetical protein
MKREVVQDFLNLPGIVGVALIDGRSRPYFCGIDQFLNFQQKEALAQGIRQVIATTPSDFSAFEFQFTGNQVYIYKLDEGLILLVMADSALAYQDYLEAITTLQSALKEDLNNAIATFRLLAGNVTLPGQNYWNSKPNLVSDSGGNKGSVKKSSSPEEAQDSGTAKPRPETPEGSSPETATPSGLTSQKTAASTKTQQQPSSLSPTPAASSSGTTTGGRSGVSNPTRPPAAQPSPKLKDYLLALNQLSQFAKQYLGTAVIVNYWRSSRPEVEWLQIVEIDRSGKIQLADHGQPALHELLNSQQQQWFQQWVAAFIKRCSVVIRDFPRLVKQEAFDENQKRLLLP